MKKIIYLVLMLMLVVFMAPAAYARNELTLDSGSQIEVNSMTFSTSGTLDEIIVYPTYFTAELSSNSNLTVTSADRYTFTVSPSDIYVSFTCGTSNSVLTILGSGDDNVYTITPANTLCSTVPTTGGGSTTGGGGAAAPAVPTVTTPATILSTLTNIDRQSSGGGQVNLLSVVTQSVTAAAGGQTALSDNSISVSLPANTVSNDASLSITPQAAYAQPKAGYSAIRSQVYKLTAQTTSGALVSQLANAATITFSYTDENIAGIDEDSLLVSYWNEEAGEWIDLPTTVDADNNTVTATTDHFTKFILQGKSSTAPASSLIKTADSPAVYYLGHDGKRYVFNDDKVYFTWYSNFNSVLTISNSEMISYKLGGNITTRPGTKLIQFVAYDFNGKMIVDDPKIYAVEPGGIRRWIETADIASTLYGSTWEQKIQAVPNYLVGDYLEGTSIAEPVYPSGAVVKETSSNNLYYISEGQKRLMTTNGRTSNGFREQYYNYATSLASYETTDILNDYQNSISWTGSK